MICMEIQPRGVGVEVDKMSNRAILGYGLGSLPAEVFVILSRLRRVALSLLQERL